MSKLILDETAAAVTPEAGKRKVFARPDGLSEMGPDGVEVLLSGTAAVATHVAQSDPHPQYTTALEAAAAAPIQAVNVAAPITSSGTSSPTIGINPATTGAAGSMSAADKTKLDGVATGATANATDAQLRDRATHTGEQAVSTVTGLQAALDAKLAASEKGAANGVAPLGADSKVPPAYLPSYVDDALEYANFAGFPGTGTAGVIYIALDTGKIYRWGGSAYAEISASPGSTDAVPEGATNLYFTVARVRDTLLAGLSTATNAVITTADTVLTALGKLQKQISDLLNNSALTGTTTAETLSVANDFQLPDWTTGTRPTAGVGKVGFNNTLNQYEGYNGSAWSAIGGGATGAAGNPVFMENDITVTGDYTITTNKNAVSAGPITINTGVTVTVPAGSVWTVV